MRAKHRLLVSLTVVGLAVGGLSASPAVAKPPTKATKPLDKATKPTPKSVKGTKWYKGRLVSIFTERKGRIVNVAVDIRGGRVTEIRTIKGCGLDVDDVPHLVAGLDDGKRVQIQSVDGCIGRINVMMKP